MSTKLVVLKAAAAAELMGRHSAGIRAPYLSISELGMGCIEPLGKL